MSPSECEFCGENIEEGNMAEIVRKDQDDFSIPHLIVHAEPCFIPDHQEEYEQA